MNNTCQGITLKKCRCRRSPTYNNKACWQHIDQVEAEELNEEEVKMILLEEEFRVILEDIDQFLLFMGKTLKKNVTVEIPLLDEETLIDVAWLPLLENWNSMVSFQTIPLLEGIFKKYVLQNTLNEWTDNKYNEYELPDEEVENWIKIIDDINQFSTAPFDNVRRKKRLILLEEEYRIMLENVDEFLLFIGNTLEKNVTVKIPLLDEETLIEVASLDNIGCVKSKKRRRKKMR